jgi:hypothetical protein
MKKMVIFLSVFLFADISNILITINKIETYKPLFKKIKFIKFKKTANIKQISNNTNNNFELQLNAVFNKKALINSMWVKKGDFIKGYKVIKIYSKRVILKKENQIIVLKLENNILKVKK